MQFMVCKFLDSIGQRATVKIYDTQGGDKDAEAMSTILSALSNAKLTSAQYFDDTNAAATSLPAESGAYGVCNAQAVITFRNTVTQKKVRLTIPAPIKSMFEKKPGLGYRVTDVAGGVLALGLGTATSQTLTYDEGWLYGYKGRVQA